MDQPSLRRRQKWITDYYGEDSSFNMTATTVQTKLNLDVYTANRSKFNGLPTSLTGQSIGVFAAKLKTAIDAGA